jgi:hypothetical protein
VSLWRHGGDIRVFTKPGATQAEIFTGVGIHEIGHNLGGIHGDPGNIMIPVNAVEQQRPGCLGNCGTGVFDYSIPTVDKNGTRAIIGRMGMDYGSVGSRYLSDKETKKIKDVTVGKTVHVGN